MLDLQLCSDMRKKPAPKLEASVKARSQRQSAKPAPKREAQRQSAKPAPELEASARARSQRQSSKPPHPVPLLTDALHHLLNILREVLIRISFVATISDGTDKD